MWHVKCLTKPHEYKAAANVVKNKTCHNGNEEKNKNPSEQVVHGGGLGASNNLGRNLSTNFSILDNLKLLRKTNIFIFESS